MAELRLVGPVHGATDARIWLDRVVESLTTAQISSTLQSRARRAMLRGPTLVDRRAAVVQAWRSGADPVLALSVDETPILQCWAGSGTVQRLALVDRLHYPTVAHVFRAGDLLPSSEPPPRREPMPVPVPMPAVKAAGQPRFLALSLCDLPTDDLATAGALLRGHALRDGALMAQLLPGPWVGLALPPGADGLQSAAPTPIAALPPLPLHLRVERQIWAALTPEGASLAAFEGAGEPAEAGRIWERLRDSPLVPTVGPQVSVHRLIRPIAESEQRIAGRLSTLGLGVVLGTDPLLPLIAHVLEWQWLRQKVRREGGAYGVRCRVGPGGALVFLTARDPAPPEVTLAHFAQSADWLRCHLRGELLTAAIRGTVEKLPPMPGTPWEARLVQWQSTLDPQWASERLRVAVAGATAGQVADLADRLAEALPQAVRLVFRGSD